MLAAAAGRTGRIGAQTKRAEQRVVDQETAIAEAQHVLFAVLRPLADEQDALPVLVVAELHDGILQPAPAAFELERVGQGVEAFGGQLLRASWPSSASAAAWSGRARTSGCGGCRRAAPRTSRRRSTVARRRRARRPGRCLRDRAWVAWFGTGRDREGRASRRNLLESTQPTRVIGFGFGHMIARMRRLGYVAMELSDGSQKDQSES